MPLKVRGSGLFSLQTSISQKGVSEVSFSHALAVLGQ